MFLGPWEFGAPVHTKGIPGIRRFLDRVWTLLQEFQTSSPSNPEIDNQPALETRLPVILNRAIKKSDPRY